MDQLAFTSQRRDLTVREGDPSSFSVSVNPAEGVRYFWYQGDSAYPLPFRWISTLDFPPRARSTPVNIGFAPSLRTSRSYRIPSP